MIGAAKSRYFLMAFLVSVFFLAHHKIAAIEPRALRLVRAGADGIAEATESGNVYRQIALWALGGVSTVLLLTRRGLRIRANGLLGWLLLAYFAWCALSLVWSDEPALTFRRLVAYSMVCLGALATSSRFSPKDLVSLSFYGCSAYLLAGLAVQVLQGQFTPLAEGFRFSGTVVPNHQGWNIGLLLIAGCALAAAGHRRRPVLFMWLAVAGVLLVLTKSRSAVFSAVISLVYFFGSRLPARRLAVVLMIATSASLFLALVFGPNLSSNLSHLALLGRGDEASAETLTGRSPVWRECMVYAVERPFHGFGFNSFWTPKRVVDISARARWAVPGAHNGYLELVLGLGIVGLALYVAILGGALGKAWVRARQSGDATIRFQVSTLVFFSLVMALEEIATSVTLENFVVLTLLVGEGLSKSIDASPRPVEARSSRRLRGTTHGPVAESGRESA